jgi:hypothetical protein
MDRNETIKILKAELKARSKKAWSVTGGRGTAWGWIRVDAPPRRRVDFGLTDDDRAELSRLFQKDVYNGGVSIPASTAHRVEYVARLKGEAFTSTPAYWD